MGYGFFDKWEEPMWWAESKQRSFKLQNSEI